MKSDLYDFPIDALLTSDEWDHVRYQISQEIEACDCKGIGEVYPKRGFPFLYSFEFWIEKKLIEAGFKKEFIKEEIWLKKLIHAVNIENGTPYRDYRWDLHPPFGFPAGTYKVSEDKHTIWFNPEVEAALLTLESIKTIKGLLVNNGVVNREAVKVYLRTLELTINLSRAGNISGKAIQGESHSNAQSEKGQKPRNVNGMTPEERKTRNEKIKAAFKTTKLSLNSFAKNEAKKHNISPSQIKKIIKP